MNPSLKQLRDALGEIDSETEIVFCVSGKNTYLKNGKEIILNVIAECEKLYKYKNAGEELVKAIENLGCDGCFVCKDKDGDCNCDPDESELDEMDSIIDTYHEAVKEKEV